MKLSIKLFVFFVPVLFHLIYSDAGAIPAFARKYQVSCQVCHNPFPSLKPFGEDFAGDGYRMTEYEAPRYFIQTGDENLSLLRELPFAIRIDGIATFNSDAKGGFDFGAPSGVKLLSGGELSENLSYYFYFFMSEGGDIVGIEDAFLTYSNLFGTGINISAGQFQACDPFYKRELRLTLEDIAILQSVPGTSNASLKYERGIMLDYDIPKIGTGLVAEVLNGNGTGNGGEEFLFDKDKFKNVLFYLSQPLGKFLNIGFMGYFGREKLTMGPINTTSNIKMLGPVVNIDFNERLRINAQFIFRSDGRVYDEDSGFSMDNAGTSGGYLEAIVTPKGDRSKWYVTGLLNYVESDYHLLDYKSATINLGYLLRRNVRLLSEYSWIESEKNYGKLSLGFVAAF